VGEISPPLLNAFLAPRRFGGLLDIISPRGRPREHARPRAIPHRAAPRLIRRHGGAFLLGRLPRCTLISASCRVAKGRSPAIGRYTACTRFVFLSQRRSLRKSGGISELSILRRVVRGESMCVGNGRLYGYGISIGCGYIRALLLLLLEAARRCWARLPGRALGTGEAETVAIRERSIGQMRPWMFSAYSSW
jgi:hypothetical protein